MFSPSIYSRKNPHPCEQHSRLEHINRDVLLFLFAGAYFFGKFLQDCLQGLCIVWCVACIQSYLQQFRIDSDDQVGHDMPP